MFGKALSLRNNPFLVKMKRYMLLLTAAVFGVLSATAQELIVKTRVTPR